MKHIFKSMTLLAAEDRAEFIGESMKRSRESVPTMMSIGIVAYSSFVFFDYICLPDLLLRFSLLRFSLVFATVFYLWALRRGSLRFTVLSKLLLTVPSVIVTSYMVVSVPKEFFVLETCTEVMLILCTAGLFPWLPREYFLYAFTSFLGSAFIWHVISDFERSEIALEYFVVLTTLVVSTLTVFVQTDQAVKLYIVQKNLMRHERAKLESRAVAIESRLAESDRNAYLAHHLGLFLHEIKNILLSLDLMADSGSNGPVEIGELLDNIKKSNDLARKRIEAFLGKIKVKSTHKESITVASEVASILPILNHDGKKNGVTVDFRSHCDLDKANVYAVPGAVSVVLFDIIRNAMNAISEARRLYPGPSFSGVIAVTVTIVGEAVQFVVEDNGIGVREDVSAAFEAGEILESSEGRRIGIGTLGMRHEAKENHFHIALTPRLGGGTTATLVVPLHRQGAEVVPSSGARKMA